MFSLKTLIEDAISKGERVARKIDYIYNRMVYQEETEKGFRRGCTHLNIRFMDTCSFGMNVESQNVSVAWTPIGLDVMKDGKRFVVDGPQVVMMVTDPFPRRFSPDVDKL